MPAGGLPLLALGAAGSQLNLLRAALPALSAALLQSRFVWVWGCMGASGDVMWTTHWACVQGPGRLPADAGEPSAG